MKLGQGQTLHVQCMFQKCGRSDSKRQAQLGEIASVQQTEAHVLCTKLQKSCKVESVPGTVVVVVSSWTGVMTKIRARSEDTVLFSSRPTKILIWPSLA